MMLKTYQAATMAEALAEVKRDLGRDAVILHTRSFRKGGLMGIIGGRSMWEVTASANLNVPRRFPRGQYASHAVAETHCDTLVEDAPADTAFINDPSIDMPLPEEPEGDAMIAGGRQQSAPKRRKTRGERRAMACGRADSAVEQADQIAAGENVSPAPEATAAPALKDEVLTRELGEIKRMMAQLVQNKTHVSAHEAASPVAIVAESSSRADVSVKAAKEPWADELCAFREQLLRQDVEETIADELVQQLGLSLVGVKEFDAKVVADRLCDLIASRIQTAGPVPRRISQANKPRVIALIGPTGVGKTTTIAKLAADYKLRRNLRVGLVTLDTYRIAAVDQLRTYAEIVEVPVRVVMSAGEMHSAVYGMPDVDVVLIDTAGRSQNDTPRLNQLQSYLHAVQPDEVHLVVAATSNRRCLRNIMARFGSLEPNRIILTKLDEAETFGTILSFAAGTAPLSFVTTGQDVPDDIEPADAWRLAQRVLKGSYHAV